MSEQLGIRGLCGKCGKPTNSLPCPHCQPDPAEEGFQWAMLFNLPQPRLFNNPKEVVDEVNRRWDEEHTRAERYKTALEELAELFKGEAVQRIALEALRAREG